MDRQDAVQRLVNAGMAENQACEMVAMMVEAMARIETDFEHAMSLQRAESDARFEKAMSEFRASSEKSLNELKTALAQTLGQLTTSSAKTTGELTTLIEATKTGVDKRISQILVATAAVVGVLTVFGPAILQLTKHYFP